MIVEALENVLAAADQDLVRPVVQRAEKLFGEIRTNTRVEKMATAGRQISVTMNVNGEHREELYDKVLVAIGRTPNTRDLGLSNTGVKVDEKGFMQVNDRQQTDEPEFMPSGMLWGEHCWPTRQAKRRGSPLKLSRANPARLTILLSRPWCSPTRRSPGAV